MRYLGSAMLKPSMAVLLVMWAVSVYAQTGAPDIMPVQPHAYDQQILITSIVGFLSTLMVLLINTWKEARNRRWDLEDRRAARQEQERKLQNQTDELKRIAQLEADLTRARAAQVEAELKAESARSAHALQQTQRVLEAKIHENTEVSKSAFKEANAMNRKLQRIHSAIDNVRPKGARRSTDVQTDKQLADIQTIVRDTQHVAHDVQPVIEETLDKVRHIEESTAGDHKHGRSGGD